MVHYFLLASNLAVPCPVFGCCLWSTAENWILREMLIFFGAMLGSTVDACSASVLGAFGRMLHIFYGEVDSDPELYSLRSHAEWRSVLSRLSVLVCVLALGNPDITSEVHVAGMRDDGVPRCAR